MNAAQIEMFIEDFIDDYSYESVADLKICLKNARKGMYGNHYQSIDGLTVMNWFKQYLDEKAQARSKRHRQEVKKEFAVIKDVNPKIIEALKDAVKTEQDEDSK